MHLKMIVTEMTVHREYRYIKSHTLCQSNAIDGRPRWIVVWQSPGCIQLKLKIVATNHVYLQLLYLQPLLKTS